VTALLTTSGAWIPARAGVWSFHGGASTGIGRTDNPEFLSRSNPAYDPNSPVCNPADPSYDPGASVCQPMTSSSGRRGATTGSLALRGGADATWATSSFDFTYTPSANYYQNRSGLNNLSHRLNSTWRHEYSPRASLSLTEYLTYTPEQNLDPNQLQNNNILVQRTRTTTSSFRGIYTFTRSDRTTLTGTYRYRERAFSSNDYVDNANHAAGFEYRRRFGRRNSFNTGYEYGLFSYKGRFPGADHHTAHVGYGLTFGSGFNLNASLGYNILLPDDPDQKSSDGMTLNGSVGYKAASVNTMIGYSHGITAGAGAFTSARSDNSHGSVRWTMTRTLSAEVAANYNVNERIPNVPGAPSTSDTIRTFNGTSTLTYAFSKAWSLTGAYAHYRQAQTTRGGSAPDIRSNRYSVGLSWSYR